MNNFLLENGDYIYFMSDKYFSTFCHMKLYHLCA